MSENDSGWDALFNPEDEFESALGGKARSSSQAADKLASYRDIPGVNGAIQVTLDGVVLHHQVPAEVEYYGALAAAIGSTARQVNRMLALDGFEYAVVSLTGDSHRTLIFREGDTFIGLLLSGEIAPTHIVTRLQDQRSGGLA